MYIVREIFHLRFGKYKEARALVDEALKRGWMKPPAGSRILTDFSGAGYRLILEAPYSSLAEIEADLKRELGGSGWAAWYEQFKELINHSEREILKQVG
jgi:hypothetical protein